MVKIILIVFAVIVGVMIYTGNMGGAKKATQNYADVMYSGKANPKGDAKPAPMYEYIKNKKKGSIK